VALESLAPSVPRGAARTVLRFSTDLAAESISFSARSDVASSRERRGAPAPDPAAGKHRYGA
jgi:hypothetical protein